MIVTKGLGTVVVETLSLTLPASGGVATVSGIDFVYPFGRPTISSVLGSDIITTSGRGGRSGVNGADVVGTSGPPGRTGVGR